MADKRGTDPEWLMPVCLGLVVYGASTLLVYYGLHRGMVKSRDFWHHSIAVQILLAVLVGALAVGLAIIGQWQVRIYAGGPGLRKALVFVGGLLITGEVVYLAFVLFLVLAPGPGPGD